MLCCMLTLVSYMLYAMHRRLGNSYNYKVLLTSIIKRHACYVLNYKINTKLIVSYYGLVC